MPSSGSTTRPKKRADKDLHGFSRADALLWAKLTCRPNYDLNMSPIRMADLFCGCGGLALGVMEAARRAGRSVDLRMAVDFEPAAIAVHRANFPSDHDNVRPEDITELFDGENGAPLTKKERDIRDACGPLSLATAGPPCQGHSDLNNSTRRDDPRNLLYMRATRAIEVLCPRVAVIENVPSVVHAKESVVRRTVEILQRAGYTVSAAVVDMRNIGLPQRRRRHVLVALQGAKFEFTSAMVARTPKKIALGPFIKDLEDEPELSKALVARRARLTPDNVRRIDYLFDHDLYDLPDASRPPCHRDKPHSYSSVYGRLSWNAPSQTITSGFGSPGQGRYIHPRRRRLITAHEAARIQGFPDFFDFSAAGGLTALRTIIGNAVPPPLMIALMSRLLESGTI